MLAASRRGYASRTRACGAHYTRHGLLRFPKPGPLALGPHAYARAFTHNVMIFYAPHARGSGNAWRDRSHQHTRASVRAHTLAHTRAHTRAHIRSPNESEFAARARPRRRARNGWLAAGPASQRAASSFRAARAPSIKAAGSHISASSFRSGIIQSTPRTTHARTNDERICELCRRKTPSFYLTTPKHDEIVLLAF